MRVVFAGSPEFALIALRDIRRAGHDVVLVLTQPDRPAGRGLRLQATAVKAFALQSGISVAQPRSLRLDGKFPADAHAARESLLATRPDVMVVAAYGLLLPAWVLDLPRQGCLNIHASLLPRWRGAAPIQRAIEAGDARTGITIMQMDAGLDTGAMLLAGSMPILRSDSTGLLHDRLAKLGGELIVDALDGLVHGRLDRTPQPVEGVTYAHKIDKAEAAVDWSESAEVIERRIRAFDPFPGASGQLAGETIKLWRSEVAALPWSSAPADPGVIIEAVPAGLVVACGQGALRLTELQRTGAKRLAAREFLLGHPLQAGMRFAPRAR